jgi:hypothetical protein
VEQAVEVRVESSAGHGQETVWRVRVSAVVLEEAVLEAVQEGMPWQMVAREEMRPEVQQPEGLETPEEILEVRTDFREVWEREVFSS